MTKRTGERIVALTSAEVELLKQVTTRRRRPEPGGPDGEEATAARLRNLRRKGGVRPPAPS